MSRVCPVAKSCMKMSVARFQSSKTNVESTDSKSTRVPSADINGAAAALTPAGNPSVVKLAHHSCRLSQSCTMTDGMLLLVNIKATRDAEDATAGMPHNRPDKKGNWPRSFMQLT